MNEVRRSVSERVQRGTLRLTAMIDEPGKSGISVLEHKETTMLKTISAALIATSLIAAPALAANSGITTGTANTTTQSQPSAETNSPTLKAAKVTSTKSKKLHTSAKASHHHKKISLHKTHSKTPAKVASKASTKPVMPTTKRS
jgi:hypothetical protein